MGKSLKNTQISLVSDNKLRLSWLAAFVGIVAVLLSTLLMLAIDVDWAYLVESGRWQPATGLDEYGNFFGEYLRDGSIRQPWNAFSSLFYVFPGAYLIAIAYSKKNTNSLNIIASKSLRIIFGSAIIITGLGSAFMHMSVTFIGQTVDVVGMYLISVFIVLYALRNVKKFDYKWFFIAYAVINAIMFVLLIFVPDTRRWLFAVLIGVGLVLEIVLNRKVKGFDINMLLAAACALGLGFILWQLDNQPGLFFERSGPFQGHVLWHTLGAVACFLIFVHYYRNKNAYSRLLPKAESKDSKDSKDIVEEAVVEDQS